MGKLFFEYIDKLRQVFNKPEIDPLLNQKLEAMETSLDYPDGVQGLIDDIYNILKDQRDSDFHAETNESLEFYEEGFGKLGNKAKLLGSLLDQHKVSHPPVPRDGESVMEEWKKYIEALGDRLHKEKYIEGLHKATNEYLLLYLGENLYKFTFSNEITQLLRRLVDAHAETYEPDYQGESYQGVLKELAGILCSAPKSKK